MKVILLAGGFGTRLAEYTDVIPKPLVRIGGKPILWHIMNYYAKFNHKDFYVGLGYKAEMFKDYFINYRSLNSDFSINMASGLITPHQIDPIDWNVTLIDTGEKTMTGGRVKRFKEFIGNETCMLTYGDGLSNVDLHELLLYHKSHGKMVTLTAVRPNARFGELALDKGKVLRFQEKPQLHEGWINGGFFVFEPEFFDLIEGDETMLEREPIEKAANMGQLMAYQHDGFWQCMDNKRDHDLLQSIWSEGDAPWDLSK